MSIDTSVIKEKDRDKERELKRKAFFYLAINPLRGLRDLHITKFSNSFTKNSRSFL